MGDLCRAVVTEFPPPVQFTKIRDGWVAYQVLGDGPRDIVYIPGFIGNLDWFWESPQSVRLFTHISTYGRVVLVDRRGCGLSDRLPPGSSLVEEWAYDALGVMDAVGSKSATMVAFDTGTPMALFTAAAFPDRVDGLILLTAYARSPMVDLPEETQRALKELVESNWGSGLLMKMINPEMTDGYEGDDSIVARLERSSLHRGEVGNNLEAIGSMDVRSLLASVQAPTLIFHSTRDGFFRFAYGQAVADAVPNARLVPIDSRDTHAWGNHPEIVLPEIDEFLGGEHRASAADRSLATVLFSDIASSTERLVSEGDRAWRSMLDTHDSIVRSIVQAHEGRYVKGTGDGCVATFDGPAKAIHATLKIRETLRTLGIELYQGLHTGEIERRGTDISGLAVHIASRVADAAGPGEVLVSSTVKDLVAGSGITFGDRGVHQLKGVPEEWRLFSVES
jgi:class 3 adenylate cyclase